MIKLGGRRFVGRVALVTGGGRGIGRAIALALAAEGAAVGVLARTESQCRETAAAIGPQGLPLTADVSDFDACERAVAQLVQELGLPSILINAAGISPVFQRAEAHDVEAFNSTIQTNLGGAFTVTRAIAPALLERGGAIVNVASVHGLSGSPRVAAYGASKAGLIQLTRTLALEWADRGVRVNAVCPGYVVTEMTEEILAVPHQRARVLAGTPLGRLGTVEEVVAPTLFLASDDASYITGAALAVDGGMTA